MWALILWSLLGLFGAVLVVAVAVVGTPWRIRLDVDTRQHPAFILRLLIIGGLVPVFSISHLPRMPARKSTSARRRPIAVSQETKERTMQAAPPFFGRVLKVFRLEKADVEVIFGLGDPGNTGAVFGVAEPLTHVLDDTLGVTLTLRPDYERLLFACRGAAAVRFTPAALIPPILGFGWSVFVPRSSKERVTP